MKVSVGRVLRSWGVDGSLVVSVPSPRLAPGCGNDVSFERDGVVCVGPRTVTAVRPYTAGAGRVARLLVRVSGIATADDATVLRGCSVVREIAALPERMYLNAQLIGCAVDVVDAAGAHRFFGTVTAVIPTGGPYHLLAVLRSDGEALVPFVREVVQSVDTAARRILVRRVDGVTA